MDGNQGAVCEGPRKFGRSATRPLLTTDRNKEGQGAFFGYTLQYYWMSTGKGHLFLGWNNLFT